MTTNRTPGRVTPEEAFHSPEATVLKQEIVDAGRKLWLRQYVDGNGGNISCRLTDEWVLCTPTLRSKGDLEPSDICLVDLTGRQLAGTRRRSSEILLHLEVFKAVPEARAVIHCHPPHATAYALVHAVPPERVLAEHEVFVGPVAMVPYLTPGTPDLGRTIIPLVRDHNSIILANHGLMTWGDTVTHAEWYVEVMDTTCQVLILAAQLGRPIQQIPASQAGGLLSMKQRLGMPDVRFRVEESKRFDAPDPSGGIAVPPRRESLSPPLAGARGAGGAGQSSQGGHVIDPRYPVGKFSPDDQTPLEEVIALIEQFPAQLRATVAGLTETQLETPYREGGWTARQVIHHLADSHLNSAIRFRLTLTEDKPSVRAYDEKKWAELPDAARGPVEMSLRLIEGLHARWAALLRSMSPEDWKRTFVHSEYGEMELTRTARLYAWHCRHHLAHIKIVAQGAGIQRA